MSADTDTEEEVEEEGVAYIRDSQDWKDFWRKLGASFNEGDLMPVLENEMGELESMHADMFESESDPAGNPWPLLAASTIAAKGHDIILLETGRLRDSLIGSGPDSVRELSLEGDTYELIFGTTVPYSTPHDGYRTHVGVTEDWVDEVAGLLLDEAYEIWKQQNEED